MKRILVALVFVALAACGHSGGSPVMPASSRDTAQAPATGRMLASSTTGTLELYVSTTSQIDVFVRSAKGASAPLRTIAATGVVGLAAGSGGTLEALEANGSDTSLVTFVAGGTAQNSAPLSASGYTPYALSSTPDGTSAALVGKGDKRSTYFVPPNSQTLQQLILPALNTSSPASGYPETMIATGGDGTIYVGTPYNGYVYVYAPGSRGKAAPLRRLTIGKYLSALAAGPDGTLFAAAPGANATVDTVEVFPPGATQPARSIGPFYYSSATDPSNGQQEGKVAALAVDELGKLYVALTGCTPAAGSSSCSAIEVFADGASGATPVRTLQNPVAAGASITALAVSYGAVAATTPLVPAELYATMSGSDAIWIYPRNASGAAIPVRTISGLFTPGGMPPEASPEFFPGAISAGPNGTLFVAQYVMPHGQNGPNGGVVQYGPTANGNKPPSIGFGLFGGYLPIAAQTDGTVDILSLEQPYVTFSAPGEQQYEALYVPSDGGLPNVSQIAVGSKGTLYVATTTPGYAYVYAAGARNTTAPLRRIQIGATAGPIAAGPDDTLYAVELLNGLQYVNEYPLGVTGMSNRIGPFSPTADGTISAVAVDENSCIYVLLTKSYPNDAAVNVYAADATASATPLHTLSVPSGTNELTVSR